MIDYIHDSILPLFLHLVNETIITKIFPSVTKISKILPIWKNICDNMDPNNLRPVNVIPLT